MDLNKRHLGEAAMALKREDLSSGLYYEKLPLLPSPPNRACTSRCTRLSISIDILPF